MSLPTQLLGGMCVAFLVENGFAQPVVKKANPHAQIPAGGFAVISVNVDQLDRSEAFQPFLRAILTVNGGEKVTVPKK